MAGAVGTSDLILVGFQTLRHELDDLLGRTLDLNVLVPSEIVPIPRIADLNCKGSKRFSSLGQVVETYLDRPARASSLLKSWMFAKRTDRLAKYAFSVFSAACWRWKAAALKSGS